ncbi:MAG: regulatory protein RecX [Capsulimonadaceae bacterium]
MRVATARGPSGRTRIDLDDGRAVDVRDAVAAAFGLRRGLMLDDDRLAEVERLERGHAALDVALAFLEPRMRSRGEIVARLRRSHVDDEAIEYAIGRLAGLGLIDDAEFAARWVAARADPAGSRPVGRRRLRSDLAAKGVGAEDAQDVLASITDEDEHSRALAAARKKLRSVPTDPSDLIAARRRLAAFLQRRGFGWETVKKVLDETLGDSGEE